MLRDPRSTASPLTGHTVGFTLVELLVVVAIVGALSALLFPAVQSAREAARRATCRNHLKQIGLALHSYVQAHDAFPPGCIVSLGGHPRYNPWTEAGVASPHRHGTSWMLMLLPHIEQAAIHDAWNFTWNVVGNASLAQRDISLFYCPSRRKQIRRDDAELMLDDAWTGGGTDYGACLGGGNGWSNDSDSSNHHIFTNSYYPAERWHNEELIGIFSPNSDTGFHDIRDGTSNTFAVGELQRLTPPSGLTGNARSTRTSQDGWALGGVATMFTTAGTETGGTFQTGGLNNNFFESPGSEHPGGAHFGMADGSVHFILDHIDKQVFCYLGAMADRQIAQVPLD